MIAVRALRSLWGQYGLLEPQLTQMTTKRWRWRRGWCPRRCWLWRWRATIIIIISTTGPKIIAIKVINKTPNGKRQTTAASDEYQQSVGPPVLLLWACPVLLPYVSLALSFSLCCSFSCSYLCNYFDFENSPWAASVCRKNRMRKLN